MLTLLLFACMEYDVHTPQDAAEPYRPDRTPGLDDDTGSSSTDDSAHPHDSDPQPDDDEPPDEDVPPEDEDHPGDYNDPPDGDPPSDFHDDCDGGTQATSGSSIYVLSWDPVQMNGALEAPTSAWYHLYSSHIAESGADQRNESAYYRVPTSADPKGYPRWGNCSNEWIVRDADNGSGPPGALIYIGTFWLEKGSNDLEMHHYCPLQRSGQCNAYHVTSDSNSTCDTSNANSVHFEGSGICVTRAK